MANSTTQFGGFLTNIGIAQQANNAALGLPWNITHLLIGDAGGEPSQTPDPTPNPAQTALVRQVYRAQLNAIYPSPADPAVLVAELVLPPEVGGWWIRELALEDGNGNFIAVAKPAPSYKPLLAQGSGRTQTIRMHVVFGNVANVTLKIDPSIVLATRDYVDKAREAAELYARNQLKAHTDAVNPHPQYLRRADVAKDAGSLAWLGTAGGTANALVLALSSSEATVGAYAGGQRFQFKASTVNTGAVTAKVGGLAAVAVKKAGRDGLVDLTAGDIRTGGLYDLNYDGTYFQLGGGVGSGDSVPLGTILSFPVGTVPPGFLELDGGLQSVATYPDLAAYLGTYYNKAGDPAGYFRVPDTRGEFLRGWDHGRGVDTGRVLGGWQKGSLTAIDINTAALQTIAANLPDPATARDRAGYDATDSALYAGVTLMGVNGTANTALPGGAEVTSGATRPRNLAVMWCIKAWSAPVNQGSIDVAALTATIGQATETKLGTLRIATQSQNDAGASDEVVVTPKKMRWGFQMLKAQQGFLVLPTWLGGFIFQWGYASIPASATSVPFALTYPSGCLGVICTPFNVTGYADVVELMAVPTKTAFTAVGVSSGASGVATQTGTNFYWFSIGY